MLSLFLNKLTGLYVKIRYFNVPGALRSFYKDTLWCKVVQIKYFFRDYIIKKPYKTISFHGEFGPELQFVLPFAYWHFKNGTLKSTVSSSFTKELYFFSKDRKEEFDTRTNEGNYNFGTPRVLYSQDYNMKKWAAVPLKEVFANDIYVFDKPIMVIANRYNMEWGGPPISYLSVTLLDFLFSTFKKDYTIIYNRPRPENITMDNSDVFDLNEFQWIMEKYPEVVLMEDLFKENKAQVKNFNHFQMMVYANSNCFISVHGGTSVLASYFGGTNIILSKKGPEHHFNCFKKLYPKLSGAAIFHAKTDDELINFATNSYLKKM